MLKRLAVALAVGCTLANCTKPYDPPVVEMPGDEPASLPSIRNALSRGDTRVVWVHGMCTHDEKWAQDRFAVLSTAMGLPATDPDVPPSDAAEPRTVTYRTKADGRRLEVSYLIWSPLSAGPKGRLREDNPPSEGGDFPFRRAALNGQLKVGLMNDCLADAVIYTGRAGDPIRRWMRQAVCQSLGGRFTAPSTCDVPEGVETTQTLLVSESLGSKVLFDAIRSLWEGTPGRSKAGLTRELASVQGIFMAANQIPILDSADRPGPVLLASRTGAAEASSSPSSIRSLVGVLSAARSSRARALARPSAPIQVVAFTDPNDLLSYRLTPGDLQVEGAKVANVIVSNAPTYLGLLERPDTTHCGYGGNPYVMGVIINGYSGALMPTAVREAASCGFGP